MYLRVRAVSVGAPSLHGVVDLRGLRPQLVVDLVVDHPADEQQERRDDVAPESVGVDAAQPYGERPDDQLDEVHEHVLDDLLSGLRTVGR